MEYLNKTSYCSSLGTAALLIDSRMMIAWMGCRGFAGNTMLRSPLYNPVPLVSLSRMTRFYMYLFIHSKGKQISFPMRLKKVQATKARPKNYKQEKQNLFIIMRSSASSSHRHSDRGIQNTPDSAILPQNTSGMTGIQEVLRLEKIYKSQRIYTVKPMYIINITDFPN